MVALRACVIALLLLPGCGGPTVRRHIDDPANPAADARAIDKLYKTFARGYKELDPDRVANLYTESALYLSPGADVLRGRRAIRDNFRKSFDGAKARGETMSIWFDRFDRRVSGDVGYEVGYYVVTYTGKDGEVRRSRGKFTVVLIRQDNGGWLFHVDSYSDAPSL